MSNTSKRRRWIRWVVIGLAAGLVLTAGVVAWRPKPVDVEIVGATKGRLVVTVNEDGRTRVIDRYQISAPLAGNLGRIELDAGDDIEADEVLARLVPLPPPLLNERTKAESQARVDAALAARRQAQAAINRSRAAFDFAEKEAARARAVVGQGGMAISDAERAEAEERRAKEDLRSANFGGRVAEHELKLAQSALLRLSGTGDASEQLEILSPVEGQVLKVLQESEGVVQAGSPIIEVGDPAALEIVIDVLSQDATRIRPGAPAEIVRWGGNKPLRAHVRNIEPSAFTKLSALGVEEQRVNVIIDLDEPREVWASLGDGYRVESRISVWEGEDVLHVPASSVFRVGEGWGTFAVEDGEASLREVELGQTNGLDTQVLSGLEEGERVIAYPSDSVRDGVTVRTRR
ncbi:MAG: efflux RND transporter periplasmic adaptor subunit [Myxococcota bacterium]